MGLTEQQIKYFETFGFLHMKGLFSDDAHTIIDRFEVTWASHGGGHDGRPHDSQKRSILFQFVDQDEYLSALLDDPRIEGAIASLLGDDFNYTGGSGNYYVGDTHWHSDFYTETGYTTIKLAFYLDPLTKDTGCLRFIPGSHHYGDNFGDALQAIAQQPRHQQGPNLWGVEATAIPAVAVETQPGDVVIFNQRIKHASFGGSKNRRMMTMNFEERYAERDLPELRDKISTLARHWVDVSYGETMTRTASPRRMKHLEQRMSNDAHLVELVAKAKTEMAEPARG